ncbi:MAG: ABC transporter substrate-binding protein [Thalassobaculales bacterium]
MKASIVAVAAALALLPGAALAQGKYVHANNSGYDTLDPHTVFDVARVATRLNFYDGLYRWVDNPPKLIPWLAESHTVSADGLTWTFKLKPGTKFHDGSELTAEDVVYSMERMLALKKGAAVLFLPVLEPGKTKAVDKHTVSFTLKEPSAIFGATVSEIHVVNSKQVKANTKGDDWGQPWLARNVAGSGSYKLKRHDPALGFIGERNKDHFYGWGPKAFDEIEFRTVLETNTRVLGLIKGDYHGLDGYLTPDQIDRLKKEPSVQILEQESMRVFYYALNNARPPLNDINFRKALNHAFDYDGFINDVMKGLVARNPTIIPNNMWGAPKDVKGYTFDLEKAKEYLSKVKEPLRPITIGVLAGFSETEQAAALFQSTARKIGIDIRIEAAPWPVISSRMQNPDQNFDLVGLWKSTYYADPNNWLGELYGSRYRPIRNTSGYSNPEVDKRIERALVSTD